MIESSATRERRLRFRWLQDRADRLAADPEVPFGRMLAARSRALAAREEWLRFRWLDEQMSG